MFEFPCIISLYYIKNQDRVLLESYLQACMTYTECTVNKLLMMDRGTVRNMWSFMPK